MSGQPAVNEPRQSLDRLLIGQLDGPVLDRCQHAPTRMRIPLPAGADPARIAGGLNSGLSSWLILRERRDAWRASDGEFGTVLILGATGAAGLLAVQNAFPLGPNRVIGYSA